MESDVAQSVSLLKLWGWFEQNKKQITWGVAIVAVVGLTIWFVVLRQAEKEVNAGEAVSAVAVAHTLAGPGEPTDVAAAYLKVAGEYPNSVAGARALLLGAGNLFIEGKYDEAKARFQNLSLEHRDNPFVAQAQFGLAACYDAQGDSANAITAYKRLIDQHSSEALIPEAKFALANLYARQNTEAAAAQARTYYLDVERSLSFSSLGAEAGMRVEELQAKYPSLAPKPAASPAPSSSFKLEKK
jgi:tetratricopeptide (TPR) repeat protein